MDALRRWWPARRRTGFRPADRRQLGRAAEELALAHLERAGLSRLDRNVRAGRGEIDLILRDGDTLVFVEVRARADGALVSAAESLSARKCAKVRETAERLIAARPDWQAFYCRFDVVAVTATANQTPEIQWLRDAF
ncbi:YraN family protein [Guyparkeria hydrothermalis]|uniref:YraN family protein n=1 Tax=Guyparkeria hydrothermalis TaxID=923 RepID=UPI0020207816|nr:YraN family protein [Guyparkeria hydrothermalis]MCL7745404.1 YraN family protein [Guyparkeria hydrothermalis]